MNIVYLSYAPVASMWAQELQARLETLGYEVSDIPVTLPEARTVLVLTTPMSAKVAQIQQDVAQAHQLKKNIIPLIPPHIIGGSLHWMPDYLAAMDYIDFAADAEQAFEVLTARLGRPSKPPQIAADELPTAFLEVIQHPKRRWIGKRFPIRQTQVAVGGSRADSVRIPQIEPQHCSITFDAKTLQFQVIINRGSTILTLHHYVLAPHELHPMQHGDLLMFNAQVVLQFLQPD